MSKSPSNGPPPMPVPGQESSPPALSFAQERLWLIAQFEPGNPVFNLSEALGLSGPVERQVAERALREVIRRHEVLRTTVTVRDGRPVASISSRLAPVVPMVDLAALPPAERSAEARRLAVSIARRPFDPERGPLVRVHLVRLAATEHVLVLSCHQLVADAASLEVLNRELILLCHAFAAGRPSPLREPPLQYRDFARRQREWLQGEDCQRQLAYWRRRLAAVPAVLELPLDRPRGPLPTYRGARRSLALAPGLRDRLRALSRREEVSPEVVPLAAYAVLLGRYAGQKDLVVGLAEAGRNEITERLVGFFANPLALRVDLGDDPPFGQLLGRIGATLAAAREHRDLPFERLVEELQPQRDTSHQPLFQVTYACRQAPPPALELEGLSVRRMEIDFQTARFDLALEMEDRPEALMAALEYDADLFDDATIGRTLARWRILLAAAVADPARRLSELPLLGEGERHQLLREWNDVRAPYPGEQPIPALFEAQVGASADAVAVVFEDQQLSYRELNRRANRLAHHLRALGVEPEVGVGLCVERSLEMVVAILGILKAGGAYVPLDPSYPPERLALMLEDACSGDGRPPVMVVDDQLADRLPLPASLPRLRLVRLEADRPALSRCSAENPPCGAAANHLAYVMYTSGSTGRPKGVSVVHRAVVRLVRGANYADLSAGEVFLQFAPISFDASTLELWAPLLNGGRLVVFPASTPSLRELGAVVERHRVTTLWLTAGLFHQMVDENLRGLGGVRQLLAGGDVLSPGHVRRVLAELAGCTVINGYGPTENTTFTCCLPMRSSGEVGDPVAIGRPIANTRVYVLDPRLRPAPIGVPGELFIAGDGLARDYFDRPALTAEQFVPSPIGPPGARLYRTGDLVRYLPDGRIEFLGRRDHQVKVRGFRIELGEVEVVLGRHPAVRESAVVARDDGAGGKRLVAWVVAAGEPRSAELRDFLRAALPEYMVPSTFVPLASLPLGPTGKVDRRELSRRPLPGLEELEEGMVAPRTPVEEVLATIWAELLEVPLGMGGGVPPCHKGGSRGDQRYLGVHDDFFALGGHSLLATRIIARIRDVFALELPLRVFFEAPTVGALAARVEAARRQELVRAAPPLVPVPRDEHLPLSFAQQRLWFLDQYQPGSPAYNLFYAYRLQGPLAPDVLGRSITEIVRRHEALRTRLVEAAGEPRQVVSPPGPVPLPAVDLTRLAAPAREAELLQLAGAEARRPFSLAEGPLIRIALVVLGAGGSVFFLNIHHVAADGWSMGLLHRELEVLYAACARGEPSPLAELPIQYADFAVWQRRWLQGEIWDAQLGYWKQRLAGMQEVLDLPTDRPRPPLQNYRGATLPVALPAPLTDALKALAREGGATLFMTLLAGFCALLARLAGQTDLTVASPIANRSRSEIEGLIGFFVNTLLLRTDLGGTPTSDPPSIPPTFRELQDRVREVTLGAYAHQDLPFEKLVEALQPERDLSRQPLFQVMFVLQTTPGPGLRLPGLAVETLAIDNGTAKFDLVLSLEEDASGLSGFLEYGTDLFDATTIRRWRSHFTTLLAEVAAGPDRRLLTFALLTPAERQQLITEWRARAVAVIPEAPTLHRVFEDRVERRPDRVAVICAPADRRAGRVLSYRRLNARANQLAHHLRALGVGPETVVALAAEPGPEVVLGLLGIFKAGGVYLPLDPQHPAERLAFMLRDAGVRVLLAQEAIADRLPPPKDHGPRVVYLDGPRAAFDGEPTHSPDLPLDPDHLAYVIYTSGTTGLPKGVAVSHRQVLPVHSWFVRYFALDDDTRVLQNLSHWFDFGVFELLTTLLAGGTLCFLPVAEQRHPARYLDALERHGLNTLHTTPSFFRELLAHGRRLGGVEIVHLGGEAINRGLVRRIEEVVDEGCRVYNGYGPTETSINSTVFRLRGRPLDREVRGEAVPIGRATALSSVVVVDRRGRPLPMGVAGELAIGGEGVARGYQNRPALSAERFVPDPFSGRAGTRLYRSGDLVRWLAGGELEFLGRIDHQVKIRGLRLELGEIEAALARHPGVRQAVVVARERDEEGLGGGERWLVAYVVRRSGAAEADAGALRRWLGESLPAYMVPPAVVFLDALPRTGTGKVDRRALPAPARGDLAREPEHVAPRNPVEELLAGIWAEVLGDGDRVGVFDDFFALGGHSLLATRVLSRVRRQLGVEPPLRVLFERPTIAALATWIAAEQSRDRGPQAPPLRRVPRDATVPLSFAQQRLWFLDRFEPGLALYNIPAVITLKGPLEVPALALGLREIVGRHEVLRTTYDAVAGEPRQVVHPPSGRWLPVVNLEAVAEPARRSAIRSLSRREARRPFDLSRGPVLRAALLQLHGEEHHLLLVVHHVAFDGWSLDVFLRELAVWYAFFAGRGPLGAGGIVVEEGGGRATEARPYGPLPIQYADFAVWQRRWLSGPVLETHLAYWRRQLADLPVVELPTDRPRPAWQSFRGATEPFQLPAAFSRGLQQLGRQLGSTVFMTLLAVFQALLGRYTGRSDLAVGSPVAGRNRAEVEDLVGFFVNTLVLRADLAGDPSFAELLVRVREVALAAYAHQDLPFELLVQELEPERDLSQSPLVQVMLVLQNASTAPRELAPGLAMDLGIVTTSTAKFDLTLGVEETPRGLRGDVEYNRDLFDRVTVRRLVGHFRTLLGEALADPERRLSAFSPLTRPERHQLLAEWRRGPGVRPEAPTLHRFFEDRVGRAPDAVALVAATRGRDRRLSYRQVNARANQLAHHLRALGVEAETVVALAAEPGPEVVVGLLAVLKAGGVYLPLDPQHPAERLAFMLRDAGARVLLAQDAVADELPPPENHGARVAYLDGPRSAVLEREPRRNPDLPLDPDHLAYVIYTSGTTGLPKGVAVSHRQVLPVHSWFLRYFGLDDRTRVLQNLSYCFDFGVFELLTTLLAGGTLFFLPASERGHLGRHLEAIVRHDLNTVHTTPSFFRELMAQGGELSGLEIVHLGGEAIGRELVRQIEERVGPGCRVYNGYGPTETSINSTVFRLRGRPLDGQVRVGGGVPPCHKGGSRGDQRYLQGEAVPIGRATALSSVQVVDRRGRPVPVAVAGELAIGGRGVARGYQKRPALTAERFVPDPFSDLPGARLYRSGDLVRWLADGELEFLGRIDHQVKIRGLRIELGEIEAALARHPGVRQAVVLARDLKEDGAAVRGTAVRGTGEQWLVAYAVRHEAAPDAAGLRRWLGESLPAYMVPSAVVFLDALPRTATGKVDRRALPAPERADLAAEAMAPRNPREEILAGIWAEVLGRDGVGIHDDFFALGGHSLLATQVVSRVAAGLGVEVSLRQLFRHPTVAGLAAEVARLAADQPAPREPLVPVARTGPLPPSFAQERLWFLYQLQPQSIAYNSVVALQLRGPLILEALRRTFEEIVRRHEVLRTTFAEIDDQPAQVIAPPGERPLPLADLCALPEPARHLQLGQVVRGAAARPFDLVHGPLWRTTLLRLGDDEHVLLLSFHHVVFDGWSVGIFVRELGVLYTFFAGQGPLGARISAAEALPLPELPIQYADFASWHRRLMRGDEMEAQLAWWREQLGSPAAAARLTPDHPPVEGRAAWAGHRELRLSPATANALRSLSRRRGATLFMTLMAAFQTLLHRHTGGRVIMVGTPIANRHRREIEGLIGFFVNTQVMRADFSDDPPFSELLARVREASLGAFARQDLPFEKLVEVLDPDHDPRSQPLFQAMFAFQNAPAPPLDLPGLTLGFLEPELPERPPIFDLSVAVSEDGEWLGGGMQYDGSRFEAATMEALIDHFGRLLEGIAADPDRRVGDLPLSSESERREILGVRSRIDGALRSELVAQPWPAGLEQVAQAAARAYLVDPRLRPVPSGGEGEIFLEGPAGAAFTGPATRALRPHPFAAEPGAVLVATGLRGRWHGSGRLELLPAVAAPEPAVGAVEPAVAKAARVGEKRQRLARRRSRLSDSRRALLAQRLRAGWSEAGEAEGGAEPAAGAAPLLGTAGSPLVPIQPRGSRPPLFCVHPSGGNVLCFGELAHALGPEQPVWGLQARGLRAGEEPRRRVGEMAAAYLEAVRRERPQGPYLLLGYSVGGLVAYEMAHRLRADGQAVPVVAILDMSPHIPPDSPLFHTTDAEIFLATLAGEVAISPARLESLDCEAQLAAILQQARAAGRLPPEYEMADVRRLVALVRACNEAIGAYSPPPYPGRVVLVRPREGAGAELDPTLGWQERVRGELELCWVPGNHQTMVRSPHVGLLAERLSGLLGAVS